mgnify:CR=1 FL=1
MKRTELTLLIAMDKSVARPLAGFVEVVCAKMPCPGVCMRLVGFGENEKTLSPLVSVQPYVETAAELRHQAVELSRTPFSGGKVSPAIGLRGVFAGLEKSRASDRIVLIVADRRDSRAKTVDGDALADELRKSGVLIRWISIDNPNAVVCVLKERGGGYVRVVERRERMTILARYSCQYGAREREFSDCILSQLRAFKSELNVERFTLPVEEGGWGWSIGRVYDLYHDVLWNNPQIFYVNKYDVLDKKGIMIVEVRKDSDLANATSLEAFRGKKIVSQIETVTDEVIDDWATSFGVNHVNPLDTFATCAIAVRNKTVDAMTAELPVAQAICAGR